MAIFMFLAASVQPLLLRSPQTAAVISAVLVNLANGDRAASDLSQLTVNPVLVKAAQAKANDMVAKGYFAHISPEGVDPWHWFKQAGYSFDYAGENLAVDFSDSGDVNTAWMNSPKHRENILDPHFTQIGIATAVGTYQGKTVTFVVQEFGTPAGTVAGESTRQQQIASSVAPANPIEPAIATVAKKTPAQVAPKVLGSSEKQPIAQAPAPAHTNETTPTAVSQMEAVSALPWWAYIVSFPRESLRFAYFLLGLLVVFALSYTTRFELRTHHIKHARMAAILVAFIGVLFVAADYFLFAQPVLAAGIGSF